MCEWCSSKPQKPSSGQTAGCSTQGGAVPCNCPSVEIQINNTPSTNDDLVGLKCEHPAHRSYVNCRVRATSSGTIRTIVLTNPDGRLRFPEANDTTVGLTLPTDGSWVPFQISGEKGSAAIGDAVIEAHCNTATGAIVGKKEATVFWFDQAHIDVTPGGSYSLNGGVLQPAGNGVNFSAQGRLRPAGVDCFAPQVSNLRIGIVQNVSGSTRQTTWTSPTIVWNPGVANGTKVVTPTTLSETLVIPHQVNDSAADVSPLYDQPNKGTTTIDANSLQVPTGCSGSAPATSNDSPSTPVASRKIIPAKDVNGGTVVGTITYQRLVKGTVDDSFVIWTVVFNVTSNEICAIRERIWHLKIDSSKTGIQKAAPANDTDPTMDPVTSPPFTNDVGQDPANTTLGGVGAQMTSFTK